MRFAIDAVFLDETMRITNLCEQVGPWRWARGRGALHVLELAAGAAAQRGLYSGMPTRIVDSTAEVDHDC